MNLILLDITTFVGHMHPLIVHLPIGFLMLATLFELASYLKRYQYLESAVPPALFLGFVSAVVACICGYTLSLTGDYDYQKLSNHKVAGIVVAVVSGSLFMMTTTQFKSRLPIPKFAFTMSFIFLFISLMYAGHQGGILTHGSDYISLSVLTEQQREKLVSVDEAFLFEDVVHPLLIKRCSQCHREGKRKGKLSMHSLSDLVKGGKNGPAVVGGKPDESEMYKRISLDPSHEDFMPADGKTPLTKSETAIIKWWIEKGMAGEGKKVAELKDVDEIKQAVAMFLGLGDMQDFSELTSNSGKEVNPAIPLEFNMALVESLRSKGVSVRVMLHHPVMLDVTFKAESGIKIDLIRRDLEAIAKNIIWLNLSDNGLTENDIDFLPLMTNIEKLRLEKNPIGDGITNHLTGLTRLEALNLNETKITSSSLEKLKQLPSLKNVYSWKTPIH